MGRFQCVEFFERSPAQLVKAVKTLKSALLRSKDFIQKTLSNLIIERNPYDLCVSISFLAHPRLLVDFHRRIHKSHNLATIIVHLVGLAPEARS